MTVNDDGVGLDEESGLTEHDLMELDKPPPQPESQELKKPLMANYKNWAGRNTFLCNAKLVSGPRDQIVPSLIVHCILLSVIFVWSTACIPFLLERGQEDFGQPTTGSIAIDFLILAMAIVTQLLAIKTQCTDPGIIHRDAKAAKNQVSDNASNHSGSSRSSGYKAHIYQ